jgi:uncharacterized protein YjbJ (UPF0337 family)
MRAPAKSGPVNPTIVAVLRLGGRVRAGTTVGPLRFGRSGRVLGPVRATTETDMDWNRVEGNWKQFKGMIREKWGQLTDDELDQMEGNREQFEGKIQEKYGIGKDQARQNVDDWLRNLQ